ncbi:tRNA (5-methylaminomethyl-2-thiouridine)(34)-methyltransferase MnmD [Maritimibacter dapengensis]|uniref:tRNA (5-methylaminomethyl-2-thiouridine)(34)-methyltransferase MnmD n=1 Tax=Maritimibacter dapengensis TaxID=2836868 RepID=A0ABS6T660_9RHOB|nr:tRNA (5-methylaminomethyl-2-thiouridine)(34)-methyltransferase MnmD [Maritimibacter dapengensis]MBV7380193.1 tRNA (5-methylaminomethyl-2-thiouridine)(34)-methyltransferase MnmD [Maritimibacter dapengensis]
MSENQSAELEWRDGMVPVSTRFDDPYFSIHDGLAETRHVFLGGNDLPERCVPGFHVAELGFGTGLNMLAMVLALRESNIPIRYTSFEAYPMAVDDIARALDTFPEARAVADPLLAVWGAGIRFFTIGPLSVDVIEGDARETLPAWDRQADAWFLDGFSPAKNPELWSPDLMAQVARHTAPGGTAATYTAAGFVRRGLEDAGFDVTRVPGYGRKRHMTVARLR